MKDQFRKLHYEVAKNATRILKKKGDINITKPGNKPGLVILTKRNFKYAYR